MTAPAYVDGLLVEWGAMLFNRGPNAVVGAKVSPTGMPLKPAKRSARHGGGSLGKSVESDAREIRSKLGSIAKKTPQAVVKISGGGRGMQQIRAHLDYITRHGRLELEDQDGNAVLGRDELMDLQDEWQYSGVMIPEQGETKEAFNLVLSMPAGTDPNGVKKAVRDFAAREFVGHQYAMVLHTFETDPDPKPSKNPHVHLVIKARGLDCTRLNPRKEDLARWREGFAESLREHGIEAAASNRLQRLNRERAEPQFVRYMQSKGKTPHTFGRGTASPERIEKAKKAEKDVLNRYHGIVKALADSDSVDDRRLAVGLVHRLEDFVRQVKQERPKGVER